MMMEEMIVIIMRMMKQLPEVPDTDCLYDIMGHVICPMTNPEEVARHCFRTPVGSQAKLWSHSW
jgi:hypothetical protein